MLTQARLKELLRYDPETGVFTWHERPICMFKTGRDCRAWNTRFAGKSAGYMATDGYLYICVERENFLAHRLAWLHETGLFPSKHIDHRNGCRSDNSFSNLRDAERWQNQQNLKTPTTNTSGLVGASWDASKGKWDARIKARGKQYHLGRFDTAAAAHDAYLAAKRELHTFQPAPREKELAA